MNIDKVEHAKGDIVRRWYSAPPGGFGYDVTGWGEDEIRVIEEWFPSIRGYSQALLERTEADGKKYLTVLLPPVGVDPEDARVRRAISNLRSTGNHDATGMCVESIGLVQLYWEKNESGTLSLERTQGRVLLAVCGTPDSSSS